MPRTRKTKFPSLQAYFDNQQQLAAADAEFRPDTMKAMGKRHNVTEQTIWRLKKGQPTSYGLAKELSDAYGIDFDSFNIRLRQAKAS